MARLQGEPSLKTQGRWFQAVAHKWARAASYFLLHDYYASECRAKVGTKATPLSLLLRVPQPHNSSSDVAKCYFTQGVFKLKDL